MEKELISFLVLYKKWFCPIFFKPRENNVTNIIVWLPHNFQMLRHIFFKFIPVNWTENMVQIQIFHICSTTAIVCFSQEVAVVRLQQAFHWICLETL